MFGKYVEYAARFAVAAGQQRQPFQADHRVAAPIGKPVIASDNRVRADGVFFFVRDRRAR